ncbi:phosphotransferase enzyme family protein [Arcticibacterium luteifluviistationis]|uniref:Aminoglycoside phosphotransferase family protein n=1 Tax=Arcticibacterium luteifluviistationis TaxID=1784714 RepID=A0A2Z4GGS1_9BACT|nr:phosphotransferase [Arcticibacterium luteifluviistationis]AWW00129.1 aminoglycoside phosphotransferase family protein [Arcticibacterium luteifluviistationis]
MNLKDVLAAWGLNASNFKEQKIGSGHIHQTLKLEGDEDYVIQKLNTAVFKDPELIEKNIGLVREHLAKHNPDYLFLASIPTLENKNVFFDGSHYWRLTKFVANSNTIDIVENPEAAHEAAKAFGELGKHLNGISIENFEESIVNFHNLDFRFEEFKTALENGLEDRKKHATAIIDFYLANDSILKVYNEFISQNTLPKRVQHHDTKINNVLLDKTSFKALAICDLDTLMPGYFISDLGDMVRTYTSSENEDSTNWDEVKLRPAYYEALIKGYLSEIETVLSPSEKANLHYAGQFMIYMQGLRFLSDYLQGDTYYPVKYDLHNFDRAKNQMLLLESLQQYLALKGLS